MPKKSKKEEKAKLLPAFERGWRILKYLSWNTDENHPVVSKSAMIEACERTDSDFGILQCIGVKDTFKSTILSIANALNCDAEGHPLKEDRWKVFYEEYSKRYSGADEGIEDDLNWREDEEDGKEQTGESSKRKVSPPVENLYYKHTFSYEEINSLIEGVLFSGTLSTKEANDLVQKIEQNLTTKFYPRGPKSICKVRESIPINWERLRENLLLIQQAIDHNVQIAFRFNGYNRHKELVPVRAEKDTVSPYYCVAYGGRYYLLACQEKQREIGPERRMSIWRIDLMTELEILEPRKKALEKRKVENLPLEWDETFPYRHLNMSWDKPISITLRLTAPRIGPDGKPWSNYTSLIDWFGQSFRFERTETEPPYGDIVRVTCSPFGMVNWALQYSDYVEVLDPPEVREKVKEKIRKLNQKYGVEN